MNIVIFDDNKNFSKKLNIKINTLNIIYNNIFKTTLITDNTDDIIDYSDNNENSPTLYILDIVAHDSLAGFELANYIKLKNQENIIIYITDFPENILYNIKHKLKALSFIIKESKEFNSELEQCLLYSHKLLNYQNFFTIKKARIFIE